MAIDPALTNDEQMALSGVTTVERYLSPVPDTTVATARLNQAAFTYPLAQVTVDTTSGWANATEGMTVYIGSTAGTKDKGVFRVRLVPGGSTLYLGELSSQDSGELPVSVKTASFADNDYVTVLQRWDIYSVLPVINPATGQIYEDFDRVVGTNNTTPPPMVNVTVNGRRNHLATLIPDGETHALEAIAEPTPWPTSVGESYTYTWDVPPEFTNVSGDTTDTLTADIPPGNYAVPLTVTGSGSGTTQRIVIIHIHDDSTNPPLLISEMPRSDSRDRTGRRMSFDLYSNRLESIPDGSCVIYFEMPTWSGEDVPTATRQFVGWCQRQDKSAATGLRQASVEIISPSLVLGQLNSTSQIVQVTGSPSTWQQIVPSLASASFMAWYMLRWRAANIIRLFNFTPLSVDPTGQRLPSWTIDKGTLLQQLQILATDRGNFGCDSEGEFYFLYHPSYQPYPRSGTVVRDSLDASLYTSVDIPREMMHRVQQVRGEAFSWDGSAPLPTPYFSDAPTSPGQGTSQTKLPAQVVTGQSQLNQLTGDHYARQNNPYPSISIKIQKNRDVYEPAQMEFVYISIPSYLSADGSEWSGNTIPSSVNKSHNPDGTSDIDLSVEAETHGLEGSTVPVPVGNDSIYSPPYVPVPIDDLPLPSLGDFNSIVVPAAVPSPQGKTISPGKGAIWVSADGAKVQRTFDITVEPPVVEDVTPDDAFFTAFVMVVHDKSSNFSRAAYALGNDGTNSKVAFTTDIYADVVQWAVGGEILGVGTQLESAGLPSLEGGVSVYGVNLESFSDTTDYVTGEHVADWTVGALGTVVPSTYLDSTFIWLPNPAIGGYNSYRGVEISRSFGSRVFTRVEITADYTAGLLDTGSGPGSDTTISISIDGVEVARIYEPLTPSFPYVWTGNVSGDVLRIGVTCGAHNDSNPGVDPGGIVHLYQVFVDGQGGGVSAAAVVSSTDYGDTWGVQVVGSSPTGDAAFCLSRYGTVALAATDGALEKATVFGGSFSSVTGGGTTGTYPIAARIPWFKIDKPSKTNNGKSPDFYKASAAAVSGETLWKVISGTATAVTPSVGGTDALGVGSNCIGTYGATRICFIGDVSGTLYVFSSKTSGASWVNTQINNAVSVRAQRFSPSGLIWILGAGVDGAYYSNSGGTSWSARTIADGCLYIELMG